MVQEDIKKHKDEEHRKVLEKYQKNREVMEEQKKQIEARRKVDGKQKVEDKEFFDKVGYKASDVYYVNEDLKKEKLAMQRGNAHYMALDLKKK